MHGKLRQANKLKVTCTAGFMFVWLVLARSGPEAALFWAAG